MKTSAIPTRIAQMTTITRMERGHLSVIRTGPDGQPYHNLQHRENGRNVTEYIPRDEDPAAQLVGQLLQEAAERIDDAYQPKPGEVRKGRTSLEIQGIFGFATLQCGRRFGSPINRAV